MERMGTLPAPLTGLRISSSVLPQGMTSLPAMVEQTAQFLASNME
jgi:hypothetical protein